MTEGVTNLGAVLEQRLAEKQRAGATTEAELGRAKLAALITRTRERSETAEARIAVALQLIDDALGGFTPTPSLQAIKRALTEQYPATTAMADSQLTFPMDDQGTPA